MDIFEELLEKTQGFPADQRQDIRGMAETLQAIGALAQADLVKDTQYVFDHLPELRKERAVSMRKSDPAQAARLEAATAKLALPDADEQFKRRAALVELSVRLKAQLRDVAHATPETDPEHLKRFKLAISTVTKAMPDEMGGEADREMMARMAFVQELRDAGGDVDLAIDHFYKNAFEDAERGHWRDAGLKGVTRIADSESLRNIVPGNQQTQDYVTKQILREDLAEHDAATLQNGVLQAMPMLAAEHLSPGQYAAYRVMIDNEHLIDWKIENGKAHFQARTLDAKDDSNTIGKILQRELNYHTIRGANSLIETTVDNLNKLALGYDGQEAVLTEKGAARMQKSTAEVLADPAAQAKNPYTKAAKGKGGVEI